MYATNSATTSPTSTLDRQQIEMAGDNAETPMSQVVLTTQINGPADQSGYTIVSTEQVVSSQEQLSPSSASHDSLTHSKTGNDASSFNAYSSIKREAGTRKNEKINSPERKDRFELIDPHAKKLDWAHSLFSCCDDTEGRKWFCLSFCCPCYVAGRVAEVAGDNGIACCMVECLFPISCYFGSLVRRKIRLQRNIIGSSTGDCFATCCCRPCTLVQQAREQNLPIFQEVERV